MHGMHEIKERVLTTEEIENMERGEAARSIMGELRRNSILMRRGFGPHAEQPGLTTGGRGRLMSTLLRNPGLGQRALSDLLHVRPQTLGEQLDKLEEAGLLERKSNEFDRRVTNLYLTEEGKQQALEMRRSSDAALTGFFEDMSDDEIRTLLTLLAKLNGAVEKKGQCGER